MASATVAEQEKGYPDAFCFNSHGAPAYGFWIRHARGIHFYDIGVTPAKPDARPLFATGGDTSQLYLDGKPLALSTESAVQNMKK